MSAQHHDPVISEDTAGTVDVVTEVRREAALLKTGALQNAIFNSANFSSIATDEKGVIQLFNVGRAHARLCGQRSGGQDYPGRHFRSAGSDRARQSVEPRAGHSDHTRL